MVEAIVVTIGEERMVIPVEIAKKLYKELGELFDKKEKEYIPWPSLPTIIYKPQDWTAPYIGDVPPQFQPKIWSSNSLTIECSADSEVSASYTVQR